MMDVFPISLMYIAGSYDFYIFFKLLSHLCIILVDSLVELVDLFNLCRHLGDAMVPKYILLVLFSILSLLNQKSIQG